jgi:hypothetical protein
MNRFLYTSIILDFYLEELLKVVTNTNKKLEIGIVDLVSKKLNKKLFARIMNANFASLMPQIIGVWCEDEGHNVTCVC